jgi:hypothetical protein
MESSETKLRSSLKQLKITIDILMDKIHKNITSSWIMLQEYGTETLRTLETLLQNLWITVQ